MMTVYADTIKSPVGLVEVTASDAGVTSIYFVEQPQHLTRSNHHINQCLTELGEYFDGNRKAFDVPLDPQGTEFQKQVWQALLDIPYGQMASYAEVASAINKPKAVRAVGAANGKNPISILVPCHRVIGSNGTLTGYAGGLPRKQWLLQLEGQQMFG